MLLLVELSSDDIAAIASHYLGRLEVMVFGRIEVMVSRDPPWVRASPRSQMQGGSPSIETASAMFIS